MSLAKYLLIVAREDDPDLDIHDIAAFFRHVLERVDWTNDLHFQTRTTIDTLDYSGHGLNQGSKVVIAAAGPRRRSLPTEIPAGLRLPDGFQIAPASPCRASSSVQGPAYRADDSGIGRVLRGRSGPTTRSAAFPLIVVVDDSEFTARSLTELPLGHLHPLEPRRRHRRHRRRSSTRSTGAAPARS